MKLRFSIGIFIFIVLPALVILSPVFAFKECDQTEVVETKREHIVHVYDFTFGGTIPGPESLSAFLEKEVRKSVQRIKKDKISVSVIFLKSLEVDKHNNSFQYKIMALELKQNNQDLCVLENLEGYREVEKSNRIQGRCLEYFLYNMEEDIVINIYRDCGWEI